MSSSNPGAYGPGRDRPARSTRAWLVVAIILVAIWALTGSLAPIPPDAGGGAEGAEGLAMVAGYIVGSAMAGILLPAVLVWLVLYFGFTRRLARQRGAAHFVALVITAAIVVAPITVLKFIGLTRGAQSAAEIAAIVDGGRSRAVAAGETQRIEQARIVAGDPFSAQALARPGGVAEARTRLAELRKSAADGRAQTIENAGRMRAQLAALPISDDYRAELLAQHDRGFAAGQADARPGVNAAEAAYAAIEGQLDVLSRRPRGWVVQGGEPVFTNVRDMNDFNAHVRELEAAQARARAALAIIDANEPETGTPTP